MKGYRGLTKTIRELNKINNEGKLEPFCILYEQDEQRIRILLEEANKIVVGESTLPNSIKEHKRRKEEYSNSERIN